MFLDINTLPVVIHRLNDNWDKGLAVPLQAYVVATELQQIASGHTHCDEAVSELPLSENSLLLQSYMSVQW